MKQIRLISVQKFVKAIEADTIREKPVDLLI